MATEKASQKTKKRTQIINKTTDEVVITINEDGTVEGDIVSGPGGVGCLDILEELLGDLGDGSSKPDPKDAMGVKAKGKNKNTIGGK